MDEEQLKLITAAIVLLVLTGIFGFIYDYVIRPVLEDEKAFKRKRDNKE